MYSVNPPVLETLNAAQSESYTIRKEKITIGRASQNDLVLKDLRVSSLHCEIEHVDGKFIVTDKSSNGTTLNDSKIGRNNKAELKHGDALYILSSVQVSKVDILGFVFMFEGASKIVDKGLEILFDEAPQFYSKLKLNSQATMLCEEKQQISLAKQDQAIEGPKVQEEARRAVDAHDSQLEKPKEEPRVQEQTVGNQENSEKARTEKKDAGPKGSAILEPTSQVQNEEPQPRQVENTNIDVVGEEILCTICDDVIFEAVIIHPCGHHFCGACLSGWFAKKQECPNCREPIQGVQKSVFLNNIIEKYLNKHNEKKRTQEAVQKLKDQNIFYNNPKKYENLRVQNNQLDYLSQGSDQEESDEDEEKSYNEDDEDQNEDDGDYQFQQLNQFVRQRVDQPQFQNLFGNNFGQLAYQQNAVPNQFRFGFIPVQQPLFRQQPPNIFHLNQQANGLDCKSCNQVWKGFKCEQGQQHRGCCACGKLLPRRELSEDENDQLKLYCCVCSQYYCTYYYGDCRSNRGVKLFTVGELGENFKLTTDINEVEQRRILQHLAGRSVKAIFDFMLENYLSKGYFYFEQTRSTLPQPLIQLTVKVTNQTPLCWLCHQKIFTQIIWKYVQVQRYEEALFMMEDCWYGINCRMQRNPEHNKRFNHMCEQTKFD